MSKPVRILMVEPFLTVGGEERIVYNLITHLDRNRFEIELLCNGDGPLHPKLKELGIPLHHVDMFGKWDWGALPKIYRIVQEGRFDLIHGHNSYAGLFTRLAVRLQGKTPIVWTDHLLPTQHHSWTMTSPILGSLYTVPFYLLDLITDRIVFVSRSEMEMRMKIKPARRTNMIFIHNGASIKFNDYQSRREEFRKKIGASPDTFVVGNVTRLKWQKGVDCFLRAMKVLLPPNPDMMGIIVGEGPDEEEYRRLADELNLGRRCLFVEATDDITGVMPGFDVAVLPSRFEGLSMTLLEYMAAGLPIIASDNPMNSEVIRDAKEGIFFPVDDHQSLAERIEHLRRNPKTAAHYGKQAKLRFEKDFTARVMAKKYGDLYLELVRS